MTIRTGMKITKDRVPEFRKAVKALTNQQVLVGIPADKADREDGETINNAQLGYIHEMGAPSRNIPARPWLVPGVKSVQGGIIATMRQIGEFALTSDKPVDEVSKGLNALGMMVSVAVKKKLTDGPFAPLSPVTLAMRKAKGHMGESPLIDTGKMLASVNYVIRPFNK